MIAEHLRVERLGAPKGIIVADPEFTLVLKPMFDDERQTTCEVEVEILEPNNSTKQAWQSGILQRKIGDEVTYKGEPLQSRSV